MTAFRDEYDEAPAYDIDLDDARLAETDADPADPLTGEL